MRRWDQPELQPRGKKAVPEGLWIRCPECGAGDLGITVWDHYGTVPEDAGTENERGAGIFIAAVASCNGCGHNITLDRARLDAHQAA